MEDDEGIGAGIGGEDRRGGAEEEAEVAHGGEFVGRERTASSSPPGPLSLRDLRSPGARGTTATAPGRKAGEGAAATLTWAFRGDEELLAERWKSPIQTGQPLADKIIIVLLLTSFCALVAFIPLDVFRWHLLGQPGPIVSSLGLVLFMAGWVIVSLCFKENTFAAPVVRVQTERHQKVIDTGVYAIVRHPMYAGALLLMVGTPLWLESYAAAAAVGVGAATIVARILVEERLLRRELEGYEEYTRKVRYRLIPFVW